MLLELTTAILEPLGLHIVCFRDGESAFEAFVNARRRPDVLITDYAMSFMNGMQLIEACRCIAPQQRTLLVSGTVLPDIYKDSPTKPDDFLAKPFLPSEFIERVQKLLARNSD